MCVSISHRERSFLEQSDFRMTPSKAMPERRLYRIFCILQKRDRLIDIEPDWVHLDTDENGIR
jgi:acyl-ACP thioesterase